MIVIRRLSRRGALFCFFVLIQFQSAWATINTFCVGNSLTASLLNPNRLGELRVSGNQEIWNIDFHIRANSSLSSFVAQPDLASDFGVVRYSAAFASTKFDSIMLEPFYGATIREEVNAAKQLINQLHLNPVNADTRILIYAVWPNINFDPLTTTWNRQDFTLDTPFVPSAKAYDLFMQELRIDAPNVEIIPAGHVFDAVLDQVNSPVGLPGLTAATQLISDGIHPTNAGSYLAGITTYAVQFGATPVGLGYTPAYQDFAAFGYVLPSVSVPIVQQISLNVINSVPEPNSMTAMLVILCVRTITARTRRR